MHVGTSRAFVLVGMCPALALSGPTYAPRRAQETVLYRVLQEHLETFVERTETGGRELPGFVKKELRAFLECGLLELGFARLECPCSRYNRLLPFSCKGRGFCPSCCGRRMAETAAHLTDHVFPHVPVRQWVLSLPFEMRARAAFDAKLRRVVLRTFIRAVYTWLRREGRRLGVADPQCGSVTFEQRFGSDLRANLHFHVLALDGVYAGDCDEPEFHQVPAPSEQQLDRLAATVHRRVLRALRRGGWVDDEGQWAGASDEPSLQLELAAASAAGRIAQGERRGARVPPADPLARVEPAPTRERVSARSGGFELHAAVALEADDRAALESLCSYIARPPIASDRLELTAEGKVSYRGADLDRLLRSSGLLSPPQTVRLATDPAFEATHSADRPVDQGMPFRDAHGEVARRLGEGEPLRLGSASECSPSGRDYHKGRKTRETPHDAEDRR